MPSVSLLGDPPVGNLSRLLTNACSNLAVAASDARRVVGTSSGFGCSRWALVLRPAGLWLWPAVRDRGDPGLLGLNSGLCEARLQPVYIRRRAKMATTHGRDLVPSIHLSEAAGS